MTARTRISQTPNSGTSTSRGAPERRRLSTTPTGAARDRARAFRAFLHSAQHGA
jgi:hypothetical protein